MRVRDEPKEGLRFLPSVGNRLDTGFAVVNSLPGNPSLNELTKGFCNGFRDAICRKKAWFILREKTSNLVE